MLFSRLFGYKFALIYGEVFLMLNLIITMETPRFFFFGGGWGVGLGMTKLEICHGVSKKLNDFFLYIQLPYYIQ